MSTVPTNPGGEEDTHTLLEQLKVGASVGNGRFLLKKSLGRGGMGMVWLALDTNLDSLVALKFIDGSSRWDEAARKNLRREARRCQKLSHPNIVRLHDLHEVEGQTPFLSMEYVEGPTFTFWQASQSGLVLPWETLSPLVGQLCDALGYAHNEGIVHRDLKPSNLMLDARQRLKLADFGISAPLNDSHTKATGPLIAGTPAYMSPQQMEGVKPEVTDDIYALGALLYTLLTSKPPFWSGNVTHQVLHCAPTPLTQRLVEFSLTNYVPPSVEATILACLDKDPKKRPQSATETAQRLGLAHTIRIQAGALPRRASRAMLAGLTLALALAATAGIWFFNTHSRTAAAAGHEVPLTGQFVFREAFDKTTVLGIPPAWDEEHFKTKLKNGLQVQPLKEDGAPFLRLVNTNAAEKFAGIQARVGLEPNWKKITVAARYRLSALEGGAKDGAGFASLACSFKGANDRVLSPAPVNPDSPSTLPASTNWTWHVYTVRVPTEATYLLLNPRFTHATGQLDLSDVAILVP
ncbi:MAG: serine/threonine protein kinase [Verrucomicrobia bacterium]|nr:serine/threonine protein kinase [Verrucomicrobiota bacterium]